MRKGGDGDGWYVCQYVVSQGPIHPSIHIPTHTHLRLERRKQRLHPLPVRGRLGRRGLLGLEQRDVRVLRQRQRHPQARVRVELGLLLRQLLLELWGVWNG